MEKIRSLFSLTPHPSVTRYHQLKELPIEIWQKIFQQVSQKDVSTILLTCYSWKIVFEHGKKRSSCLLNACFCYIEQANLKPVTFFGEDTRSLYRALKTRKLKKLEGSVSLLTQKFLTLLVRDYLSCRQATWILLANSAHDDNAFVERNICEITRQIMQKAVSRYHVERFFLHADPCFYRYNDEAIMCKTLSHFRIVASALIGKIGKLHFCMWAEDALDKQMYGLALKIIQQQRKSITEITFGGNTPSKIYRWKNFFPVLAEHLPKMPYLEKLTCINLFPVIDDEDMIYFEKIIATREDRGESNEWELNLLNTCITVEGAIEIASFRKKHAPNLNLCVGSHKISAQAMLNLHELISSENVRFV